ACSPRRSWRSKTRASRAGSPRGARSRPRPSRRSRSEHGGAAMTAAAIPPGSTIGILGAGQLGRMTALAAAELGYRTVVLTPEEDAPASHVSALTIHADYTDEAALAHLARVADVVTLEFENVPAEAVSFLESLGKPVRPG